MNYVNELYSEIAQVAPVLGVLDNRKSGGEIVVSYSQEPTAEQKKAADEIVEDVEDREQHEHLPLDVGISHHLRLLHLREGLPVNTDHSHPEEGSGSLATR